MSSLSLSERQQVKLLLRATKPAEASDLHNGSHSSEDLLRHSTAINTIVPPEDYLSWTGAKRRAWDRRFSSPSGFFYHYLHPSFLRHTGPWTTAEHTLFIAALQRFPYRDNWAAFSLLLPGRVGTECRRYYQSIVRSGFVTPTGMVRNLLACRASVTLESARKGRAAKKIVSANPLFLRRILKKFTPSSLPSVDDSLLLPACKKQKSLDGGDSNDKKNSAVDASEVNKAVEKEPKTKLIPSKDMKRKILDGIDKQIPGNDITPSLSRNSSSRSDKTRKTSKDFVSRTPEEPTNCMENLPACGTKTLPKEKMPLALDDSEVKVPRISEVKDYVTRTNVKQVPCPKSEDPTKATTMSKSLQDGKRKEAHVEHQKPQSRHQRDKAIELRLKRKADDQRQANEDAIKRKKIALLQSIKALASESEERSLHDSASSTTNLQKSERTQSVRQSNGRVVGAPKHLSSTMRKSSDGKKWSGFKLKRNLDRMTTLTGKLQGTCHDSLSHFESSPSKISRQNRKGSLLRIESKRNGVSDLPSTVETKKDEDKSSLVSFDPSVACLHVQAQDEHCNQVDQPKSSSTVTRYCMDPPRKIKSCEDSKRTSSSSTDVEHREVSSNSVKTDNTASCQQVPDFSTRSNTHESSVQSILSSASNDADCYIQKPPRSQHSETSGKDKLRYHQKTYSTEHVNGVSSSVDTGPDEKALEPIVHQSWSMRKRCQARPPLAESGHRRATNLSSIEQNAEAYSLEIGHSSKEQVDRHYPSSPSRTGSENSELSFGSSDDCISLGFFDEFGNGTTGSLVLDGAKPHSKEEKFATQSQFPSQHQPPTEPIQLRATEEREYTNIEAVHDQKTQLSDLLKERIYVTREMIRMYADDIDPVGVELGHGCQRMLLLRDFDAHYQRIESCPHSNQDANAAGESLLNRFMERFKELEAIQHQHLITTRRTNFILFGK